MLKALRRWWLRVRIRALEDEIVDIDDEILDATADGHFLLVNDLVFLRNSFEREIAQLYNRLVRLK